jgi:uncharacterized protein (DUF1778 family)
MAAKTKHWNLRINEDEDSLAVSDVATFEWDQDAWDELSKLLERPARVPEGLAELFSKPSVAE